MDFARDAPASPFAKPGEAAISWGGPAAPGAAPGWVQRPAPAPSPATAGQPPLLRGDRERDTWGAPGPAGGWVVAANFGRGSLEGGRVLRSGRVVRSASWGCLGLVFLGVGGGPVSFFSRRVGRNCARRLQRAQLSTDARRARPVPRGLRCHGAELGLRAPHSADGTEPAALVPSRPVPSGYRRPLPSAPALTGCPEAQATKLTVSASHTPRIIPAEPARRPPGAGHKGESGGRRRSAAPEGRGAGPVAPRVRPAALLPRGSALRRCRRARCSLRAAGSAALPPPRVRGGGAAAPS